MRTRSFLLFTIASLLAACGGAGSPLVPQLRPVSGGWISSGFGLREDHPVLGRVEGRLHDGYDFAVAEGTPVRATMGGEVTFAGERGGYGKTVIIQHADGWTTLYGHARELRVGPGDRVAAGEVIAFVGSTGLSTGPHLHYELRKAGVARDPGEFLPDDAPPALPREVAPPAPRPATAVVAFSPWEGTARLTRPAKTWE